MIHEEMTVGWLKKFIEENNIPDDSEILVERVHDVYYTKYGWSKTSVFKDNDMSLDTGDESFKTEYHPIWCPVKYRGDNRLYLDLHY